MPSSSSEQANLVCAGGKKMWQMADAIVLAMRVSQVSERVQRAVHVSNTIKASSATTACFSPPFPLPSVFLSLRTNRRSQTLFRAGGRPIEA